MKVKITKKGNIIIKFENDKEFVSLRSALFIDGTIFWNNLLEKMKEQIIKEFEIPKGIINKEFEIRKE